jgi:hypothetical protein
MADQNSFRIGYNGKSFVMTVMNFQDDRAIVQAASCRLLTAEVLMQSQGRAEQNDTGAEFPLSASVLQ